MKYKICMHGVEMGPSKEGTVSGGVPNSVYSISKALSEKGMEIDILSNDRKYREIQQITTNFNVPYANVHLFLVKSAYPSTRYSLEYFYKTVRTVRQINKDQGIDIIHGHSGLLPLATITSVSGITNNIPSVHSLYCPLKETSNPFYLYKYFSRKVDKLIVISENIKQSLEKLNIPEEKIEIIPPYIDFTKFKPDISDKELRIKLGIHDDDIILMYLGNLTETKGIDQVLELLYNCKKYFPNVKLLSGLELTHTGTGERIEYIKTKIKNYNLQNNIIEMGLIQNIERYFDIADILIAPFKDTFDVADYPLTILESMAVGTPVVTTPVGGIPEIIKNKQNGILVQYGDINSLTSEVIHLIEDEQTRIILGKTAMSDIRSILSDEKIISKTIGIYEGLMHE
jgi:glycosyltransferase involved in cell wall biosynthesis